MGGLFSQNCFDDYSVRLANEQDTAIVLQLLKDVANWLREKGIQQWGYLGSGGEDQEINQDILAGTTYVVEDAQGNIVATFNLSPKQNDWDVEMWGERNDEAYYLHRLAVARGHHNQQIGKRLLRWIDDNMLMNDGYLRLDCVAGNPVLNDYYQQAGFTFSGYTGEGEDKFSKYEKPLSRKA
ncbi:GNAT family N-acetyltransferase [Lentibacillus sp. Marseille-P4043]|uniref:GNAT family N-acetyltransferase n=1 Tax=Lentibacillus sp. Marseille-P4043 TaxID=2040293 RepID=UPI000D0B1AB7|nr:GNAT family N-acetyltransferase [Lentibacillus sp. Marseille-P4043]